LLFQEQLLIQDKFRFQLKH